MKAHNTLVDNQKLIVIGSSTGGTEALLKILSNLPKNNQGIVVVQHFTPGFSKMFAERLNSICEMTVSEAKNGDIIKNGHVLIATSGKHIKIMKTSSGYIVTTNAGVRVSGHCPSVDVLFESAAETAPKNTMGIILTGMGEDGARGMVKIKKNGGYTIGQDKETSVVYGMPKKAFELGGVTKQLPLEKISEEIRKF